MLGVNPILQLHLCPVDSVGIGFINLIKDTGPDTALGDAAIALRWDNLQSNVSVAGSPKKSAGGNGSVSWLAMILSGSRFLSYIKSYLSPCLYINKSIVSPCILVVDKVVPR